MYDTTYYDAPVGRLLLAAREDALVGLWIENQKYYPAFSEQTCRERPEQPILRQTRQWLDRYFAGACPTPEQLSLTPAGSEFRKLVWKLLCEIPYGQVTTYGALTRKVASALGREHMSAQAVGGAVAHNPISIIIPCHRVVGADGSLTGYAGGLQNKRKLLALEGVNTGAIFSQRSGVAPE